MFWEDEAIVLSTSKFSENAGVAVILTHDHGLHHGMVKYLYSKKNRSIFQPGNCLQVHWQARLSEHLGTLTGELIDDIASWVMLDKDAIGALSALCALLATALPERDPAHEIYLAARQTLAALKKSQYWQAYYIELEMLLLQQGGFALDLTCCAATEQKNDLVYISPKTGRAVSRDAGLPYHDRLLPLPEACINPMLANNSPTHFQEALGVLGYFLTKHIYASRNKELPAARLRLQDKICGENISKGV